MDTIGIVSLLEGEPYKKVKSLWKLFEKRYESKSVQMIQDPHLTFQAGWLEDSKVLVEAFSEFSKQIKPFNVEVKGFGHFDSIVIYLKVIKTNRLFDLNKSINSFLSNYCVELFPLYKPEIWVPHITLAMDDLTEDNFKKAWNDLKDQDFSFRQTIHNFAMIELDQDEKINLVKKFPI